MLANQIGSDKAIEYIYGEVKDNSHFSSSVEIVRSLLGELEEQNRPSVVAAIEHVLQILVLSLQSVETKKIEDLRIDADCGAVDILTKAVSYAPNMIQCGNALTTIINELNEYHDQAEYLQRLLDIETALVNQLQEEINELRKDSIVARPT